MTIRQHNTTDERDLIRQVRAGDAQGFHRLYALYADRVYGFVLRLSGSASEAEDIAQEVFLAAYAGRAGFGGRARLLTWLLGIASRRWRDRCRQHTLLTTPLVEDGAANAPVFADTSRCLETDVVNALTMEQALSLLDAQGREALLLVVSQGLTYREAADVMNEPIGTTKWRVAQATRRMAASLNAVEEEFHAMHYGTGTDAQACRG